MGYDDSEVIRLSNKLDRFLGMISDNLDAYDQKMAEELLALVIQKASGPPGPHVVSGRYISLFRLQDRAVVNASPQTHRLEYGFAGTDSLGRVYHQPPFPHFRPALQEMRERYRHGIVPLINQTWKST
jgi:hypothetical protein